MDCRCQGQIFASSATIIRCNWPIILATLKAQIESAAGQALPGTKFSQACQYTLKLWPRLLYFLEYPELELSTN
ncbi:MAG: transposase, partial [Acidobacteriales bacterium]|nr:transposase [Terriglobales bacterium]